MRVGPYTRSVRSAWPHVVAVGEVEVSEVEQVPVAAVAVRQRQRVRVAEVRPPADSIAGFQKGAHRRLRAKTVYAYAAAYVVAPLRHPAPQTGSANIVADAC
jgi:hypothetical protein